MRANIALLCFVLTAALAAERVYAFGADGHRIAGLIAEQQLCAAARDRVRALGNGAGLDELGLWADRVRRTAAWSHSGPWHYMNIDDDASLDDYQHPPEGDILEAIERYSAVLVRSGVSRRQRADALRFVTHFVVDLHQPLHVGRAADRGGNRIEVVTRGLSSNLHRFWDTDVIALEELPPERYAQRLAPLVAQHAAVWAAQPVRVWAEESLALRPQVYDFDPAAPLDEAYLAGARRIVGERLAQAGIRLAAVLNDAFCPATAALSKEDRG